MGHLKYEVEKCSQKTSSTRQDDPALLALGRARRRSRIGAAQGRGPTYVIKAGGRVVYRGAPT